MQHHETAPERNDEELSLALAGYLIAEMRELLNAADRVVADRFNPNVEVSEPLQRSIAELAEKTLALKLARSRFTNGGE